MNTPYEKQIHYLFKVSDNIYAITEIGDNYICIEETRKNGQEDTHMYGMLQYINNKWVWSTTETGREQFDTYDGDPDGILEYIKKHGLPT